MLHCVIFAILLIRTFSILSEVCVSTPCQLPYIAGYLQGFSKLQKIACLQAISGSSRPHTTKSQNVKTLVVLALLLAGDIQTNPGPALKDTYPCGFCEIPVNWSQRGICCDECSLWYHVSCLEYNTEDYERIAHNSFVWMCGKCHTPNHSCGLYHSYMLEISNYYNPLSDLGDNSSLSLPSVDAVFDPIRHSSPVGSNRANSERLPSTSNLTSRGPRLMSSVSSPHSTQRSTRFISDPGPSHISEPDQLPQKENNWRTLVINANSVAGKKAELAALIEYTCPDSILITETKLDETISTAEFLPDNYKAFRKDRKKGGGGVMVAVKNKYCAEETQIESDCEVKWVTVHLQQQRKLYLGAFYRQPNNKTNQIEGLKSSLEKVSDLTKHSKNATIILGGDFNAGDIDWDRGQSRPDTRQKAVDEKLLDTLNEHHLTQVQRQPTRQDRVLDLFCTNKPGLVKANDTIPGLSDHDTVLCDMNVKPTVNKKQQRKIHLFSKADWDNIKRETTTFQEKYLAEEGGRTIEENWVVLKNFIDQLLDKYVPIKLTSTRYNLPWFNAKLRRMCRRKHRLYKKAMKSKKQSDWSTHREFKKRVVKELREAQWQYINNILVTGLEENDTRPFWKYVKSQKQEQFGVAPLLKNGVMHNDSKQKATILNEQFQSVFTRDSDAEIPPLFGDASPEMPDFAITTSGVQKLLDGVKPNKASGPDGIPCRFLKELSVELAPVVAKLFSQSLNSGHLPQDWLRANVAPIYKKSNRHKAENYRPVSLTCVLCKLLEHIVCKHVMTHLESHNILSEVQHGFRKEHSCESQLLVTLHDLMRYYDQKTQTDVAVLDFSKAFDTVPHHKLLAKLDHYGIRGKAHAWIAAFLKGRTQKVVVDGVSSDAVDVVSGVPQGTVLGPILFLIHINDLPSHVKSTVRLFADDCLLYRPIHSTVDQDILQSDLDALEVWGAK